MAEHAGRVVIEVSLVADNKQSTSGVDSGPYAVQHLHQQMMGMMTLNAPLAALQVILI